ncbi:MAG: hypothetical protein RIR51_1055 [Bacteroidota bacterium]
MSEYFDENRANFSKSFRGYNVEEVLDFIQEMNSKFRELNNTLQKVQNKNQALEVEIEKYKQLENSMLKAIEIADKHQNEWLETQKQQLQKLEKEAREKSNQIIENAQKEAKKWKLVEENSLKSQKSKMEQELVEVQRELKAIKEAKKQISDEIETILGVAQERVKPKKNKVKFQNKKEKSQVENQLKPVEKIVVPPKPKRGRPSKVQIPSKSNLKDDGLPTVKKVLEEFNKKGLDSGNIADIS